MRATTSKLLIIACILLGGCATSLRPVAPDKDCAFDPSVLGTWKATDEDGKTTTITVEKKDPDGYLVSGSPPGPDYRETYFVKFFRLGPTLFYDSALHHLSIKGEIVDIDKLNVYARHTLGKIRIQTDEIRISALDGQWIKKALDEKRVNLKFENMSSGLWDDILLTGPAEEIRTFLEKYAEDKGAFPDEVVIKRQK
jgi:hypothetical protein